MKTVITALLFALLLTSTAQADPPNFVIIFIDDMGYGDIGPFGSELNETPNLDRMAEEGRVLTSFYVAAPVCTPSRAALMTGSYPRRVGLGRGSDHAVLFPGDIHGLHPNEITIAEILQESGYATGCFGKWHLGDQPGFFPTDQGFDEYFGIPYSNDMWPGLTRWHFPALPVLRATDPGGAIEVVDQIDDMDEQATLCRRITEAATSFIQEHRDEPFFAYVPHAFVHNPRKASPEFMAKAANETEAQIEEVDWSVGEILDTLREEGLAENTFVLFTSDNGGAGGCVNLPLRGGKGSAFEGGMREPTVIWGPSFVPAGTKCDEIMTSMDILPTFAKWAGAGDRIPTDRTIDGCDILPLFTGELDATTPHDRFFYHQGDVLRAVRSGPWKLFLAGQLYNLEDDIAEKKNVATDHPEIVERLSGYMQEFEVDLAANSRPVGIADSPRTLLPRPGVEGEEAYTPTLELGRQE
jgi:arylsulfatase A